MSAESPLRRTLALVRPDLGAARGLMVGGCLALVADVAFRVLEPWPMKIVIDSVLSSLGTQTGYRPASVLLLIACGLAHLGIVACRAGGNYLATLCFALTGSKLASSLRARVFHHVQGLEQQFHARNRSADTVQRIVSDIARIQEVAITAGLPLVANSLTLLVMLIVMAVIEPLMAAVVLLALACFGVISTGNSAKITAASRRTRQGEGHLANTAHESLTTIKVVQAYGLEDLIERRFVGANRASLRQGVKAQRLAARLERGTDVIIGVAMALVLIFGGLRVLAGAMTPGELVLFASYLRTTMKPMRDMAKYTGRIARATASGERVAELMAITPQIASPSAPAPLGQVVGSIGFDRVSADYDGVQVLHSVSLSIAPGEQVALIGPSGSGKSTLVSLLIRSLDPSSGRVTIDGHPVDSVDLAELRASIALLHQEAVLFTGTIRENIELGRPGATDIQIRAAAQAANADGFIRALPEGYETQVGERGGTLSGGQRQRIAIARALLRDAPIVILDEATTGLDPESAGAVLDAITRLTAGRTSIAVTHDAEVALRCSRIVWLEDGRVVLDGSPEGLLAESGLFRSWVNDSSAEPRSRR